MLDEDDRRDFARVTMRLDGSCAIGENSGFPCRTVDLSYRGARLETAANGRIGAKASVTLPGIGTLSGHIVRVTADGFAVEFDAALSADRMAAINGLLMAYRDPDDPEPV